MKHVHYITLLLMIMLTSQCGLRKDDPVELFQESLSKEAFRYIDHFEGDGAIVFPEFMSWGIFNYTCDSSYINYLQAFSHYPIENKFNSKFKSWDPSYFPKNTEFYTKDSKKNLKVNLVRKNCIYISGVRFPYNHDILIDTSTFEVVHLVSGVRE